MAVDCNVVACEVGKTRVLYSSEKYAPEIEFAYNFIVTRKQKENKTVWEICIGPIDKVGNSILKINGVDIPVITYKPT